MYICPICSREFTTEEAVAKHLLCCWKEEHPYHKAKTAPHSEDISIVKTNEEVMNFFNSLQKR